ncbi:putative DNA (cytosine-5-)-methyltransferase [Helianthus anomalus]
MYNNVTSLCNFCCLFALTFNITNIFLQLPVNIKLSPPKENFVNEAAIKKRKWKSKEGDSDIDTATNQQSSASHNRLATLDIFAGCGGLSDGLQKAACLLTCASITKWAIEYEEPAGDAFRLNHPDVLAFVHNCNVILRFNAFS